MGREDRGGPKGSMGGFLVHVFCEEISGARARLTNSKYISQKNKPCAVSTSYSSSFSNPASVRSLHCRSGKDAFLICFYFPLHKIGLGILITFFFAQLFTLPFLAGMKSSFCTTIFYIYIYYFLVEKGKGRRTHHQGLACTP